MARRIIAGDIGGTSSRFAAFEGEVRGPLALRKTTWLKTAGAESFPELIAQLNRTDLPFTVADADIVVIAIAGPVEGGVYCKPPLIAWDVDLSHAERDFGIKKFALINDFLAQAFAACSELGAQAAVVIPGTAAPGGAIGVIGAGTGLGKAMLLPDLHGGYIGGASEGGHTSFAPENERELEFARFVQERRGGNYASWNDIVSGRGIALIHHFLTGEELTPAEAANRFSTANETLEWVVKFYARVCRNFALEVLATGGLFVAGGVAAKNPILLTHPLFSQTFGDSRAHGRLLSHIPVRLIDNEESGLWGAGQCGLLALSSAAK